MLSTANCGFSVVPFTDAVCTSVILFRGSLVRVLTLFFVGVRILVSSFAHVCRYTPFVRCRDLLIAVSVFAICSLGVANALVLMRVVLLWENNQVVWRLYPAYLIAILIS